MRPLIVLLLLAAPALGQGPPPPAPPPVVPVVVPVARIDAPASVPAGGRLVLLSTGSVSKSPLQWSIVEPADVEPIIEGGALVIREPVPGITYRFALVAIGDVPPFAFKFANVPVLAATPPPPPPLPPAPQPGPDDRPRPTPADSTPIAAGHLYATLFYDINDPSVGAIRESAGLQEDLAKLDCNLYKLATTAPAAQPFAAEVAAVGTPCVLFQGPGWAFVKGLDGKPFALKSPKSPADVIAQVRKLRGVAQ